MSEIKLEDLEAVFRRERLLREKLSDCESALDAQRLRADTAEAELEVLRQQHAEQSCIFCNNSGELLSVVKTERLRGDAAVGDANEAERKLAAAEQRIAELLVMLRQAWVDECVSAADCRKIDAALKPNPEGHYSDCATNNRGVPELLGPCDCGYEDKSK